MEAREDIKRLTDVTSGSTSYYHNNPVTQLLRPVVSKCRASSRSNDGSRHRAASILPESRSGRSLMLS
jgi:hypothetical protein